MKAKRKQNKRVIRSMTEFEKLYFPKSFEKEGTEKVTDPHVLGAKLAKDSLDRIKQRLPR